MKANLQARLSLLESILGSVGDAILVTEACPIDEPGPRIVYVNEAFTRMTGYTYEETLGKTPRILQGTETGRARLDEVRTALSERKPVKVELLNYRKDGEEYWAEVDIVPVMDEHGNHTHWVSVQRDVTERRSRQRALEESEEWLRGLLVRHATDMITILETDGTIRYQSSTIANTLGYLPEEVAGKSFFDYVHPEDIDRTNEKFTEILHGPGGGSTMEVRVRHVDGSWRCIEGVGNNLLDDPRVNGVVINSRDITERKRVEDRLKSAEERYRALVEQVPAIIYIHEPRPGGTAVHDHEVSYISPRVEDVLGYPPHMFTENRAFWNEIIHPDDRAEVRAEAGRTNASDEPFLMEYRVVSRGGSVVWIREEGLLTQDPEGEPAHWQVVMTDITERKLAEEASRSSEVKFRSVVQNSSEVIKITEAKGTLKYASPSFERVFGYDPEEAIGINVLDYVHPEDLTRVRLETEKTLESPGENSNMVEYRFRHADGSWRWVESVGTYLLEDPAIGGVVVNVRDVTERKRAEEQLRRAEERYRTLVERIPAAVYIQKPRSGEVASYDVSYMSPKIEDVLGYPARRFIEDRNFWKGLIHPDDLAGVVAEDERTDVSGETFSMEYRMFGEGGREVWVRDEAELICGPEGMLYWQGVIVDVTGHRQAQDALRESEERYRSVAESVREVVFQTDAEGRYTFLNAAWEELAGFTVEESLGKSYLEFIHPDDLPRNLEDFERMGGHGGDYAEYETRFRAKDGRPRDIEIKFREHFDEDGDLTGTSGTLSDITNRKETERALQESEQRFRQLFEQSVDAIYVHDEEGRFVDCNSQACRLLGYTREELLSMSVEEISSNVLTAEERIRQEEEGGTLWQQALAGEPGVFSHGHEEENRRKDGTTFPVEVRVGSVDYGGRRMVLASVRDVTERVRAEAALRESEEKYRSVVDNIKEVVFRIDARGLWTFLNPAWEEITGFPVRESLGENFLDYLHSEDRERNAKLFRLLLEREKDHCRCEMRCLTKDGGFRWVEVFARLTLDADGTVLGTSGTLNDITERKKAENELLESEQRFRGAAENASAGVALVGLDNRYLWVNRALCEMLGYPEEVLLSKKSFDVTHPEDLEKSRTRTRRLPGGNNTGTERLEKRYLKRDGNVVWAISDVSLVRDSEGNPSYFVSHFQDITERKNLEEQLSYQAHHDPLTSLPNRSSLKRRFERLVERSADNPAGGRSAAGHVAILFLDLDGFKEVNDSLGHAAGDELLKAVAERLRNVIRPEDIVARLGGDEFCVLLTAVSGASEAVRIAERLKTSLETPFSVVSTRGADIGTDIVPGSASRASISTSIGIAVSELGGGGSLLDELLREADVAMYRAKKRDGVFYEVVELTENTD